MQLTEAKSNVAIACGGTGGHLFPGLAVAEELQPYVDVTLLISHKAIDQSIAASWPSLNFVALPAVGLQRGTAAAFVWGLIKSYRQAHQLFRDHRPLAVLAMGGFTSAPAVLAARRVGSPAFLHEANSVAGRANRWLARWVKEAFVYFPSARESVAQTNVQTVGMPVRPQFQPMDSGACRMMLGLAADRPVLLVMGGSQGAVGINQRIVAALASIHRRLPEWQYLHLTGTDREPEIQAAYAAQGCRAIVRPFLTEMELALNAATLAVSRAGASALAELAAVGVPAILIPYPSAADNHQYYNAKTFADAQAACLLQQSEAQPEWLARQVEILAHDAALRARMKLALGRWHQPLAARIMAERMLGSRFASLDEPAVAGGHFVDSPSRSGGLSGSNLQRLGGQGNSAGAARLTVAE
jgi:UDP-N-acetylglucosamine--N-acetylmuramyl-(pentapeptide) pyrophosphoryl-undecaprenol N-acetylglucosamine transferase